MSSSSKPSRGMELTSYSTNTKAGAAIASKDEGLETVSFTDEDVQENVDDLKRNLSNRQIQLIAIGGSIGTALFVSIGYGLIEGGPGSLFLGFTIYTAFLSLVNNCMAEMAIFMPVSGGFVRQSGKWVDEAFGFMAGWNFLIYELMLIPFEIAALNLVLTFWSDNIPVYAVCIGCIVLYALINLFAVKWYGESEFWLAGGKVILIAIVFMFTFVTMVGGNPEHDAYGFRYWKNPGAFAEYVTSGALGRFEGFLAALFEGAFTIVGPEYLSMVAGEAKHPRKTMNSAFKSIYWRFTIFYIIGALCVGIVVPYNDPGLIAKLGGGTTNAAASPYVIAMQNMGIVGLPHLTNALLVTSIFSAGNTYVYASTRTLYGLSLEGQAPKIFRKCTKNGVPIYCFFVVMLFPFLSLLQVGSSSAEVITWLADLTEASQLINYMIMCITYIFFHRALRVQNIPRSSLPYTGWFQPYCAWAGLIFMAATVGCYGYTTFLPGYWSVGTFFQYYLMVFVCPILYVGWKVWKKTKIVRPEKADLVWDRPQIDRYEASCARDEVGFWEEARGMLRLGRKKERVVQYGLQ